MCCYRACSSKRRKTQMRRLSFHSSAGLTAHQNNYCWKNFGLPWRRCKPQSNNTHHRLKWGNGIIGASSKVLAMG